jgi:hypothetical protein
MDARRCSCGVLFTPKSYQQKRCDTCRFAPAQGSHKKTPTRYCVRCATPYVPLNSRDFYCGDVCRARRERPSGLIEKPCLQCGKVFNPTTNQKYCASCLKAGARSRNLPKLPDKPCEICGASFSPRCRTQNVCSPNCRQTRWYRAQQDKDKAS